MARNAPGKHYRKGMPLVQTLKCSLMMLLLRIGLQRSDRVANVIVHIVVRRMFNLKESTRPCHTDAVKSHAVNVSA